MQTIALKEIADVKTGLQTGDNNFYLLKNENANGSYKIVDKNKVLNETELNKIVRNQKLRITNIENGINKKMFKGKTIVPYDKGGSSDIESKRLNNYFSPTEFFIDWSESYLKRMKTLTVADRKKLYDEKPIREQDKTTISAVFRNTNYYFRPGITFSTTGLYAPTYRLNSNSIFDNKGSCLFIKNAFTNIFTNEYILGILCSKLLKYIQKNFIKNTVDSTTDDIKENPIPICDKSLKNKIENLVEKILNKQKTNLEYNYQENEQIEIDNLIYQIFGLKSSLVQEVENWYSRKYPKLTLTD